MNTCVCVLLSPTPRYLALQSIKDKTTVTHNNFRYCRVHFYAFLRQPFSKQLYTFEQYDNPLVRSSVSQISIYIKNMPQNLSLSVALFLLELSMVAEAKTETKLFRAGYEGRKAFSCGQAKRLGRPPLSSVNLHATLNYIYGLALEELANFASK